MGPTRPCMLGLAILLALTLTPSLVEGVKKRPKPKTKLELAPYRQRVVMVQEPPLLPPPSKANPTRECYTRHPIVPTPPSILNGWPPMCSVTYKKGMIHSMVLKLDYATKVWDANALHMNGGDVAKLAHGLIDKLGEALEPNCKVFGWHNATNDEDRQKPLMAPLAKRLMTWQGASRGVDKPYKPFDDDVHDLCMPLMEDLVKGIEYLHFDPKGYINVHMGHYIYRGKGARKGKKVKVNVGAHVLVCWLFHGTKGKGMQCAHKCGHPNCINPHHLRWVKPWQNAWMRAWHKRHGVGKVSKVPKTPKDNLT